MGQPSPASGPAPPDLLELYDAALPHVYGYLVARCGGGGRALAEDLTAETFMVAVDAVRRPDPPPLSVAWLIGVARHKLIDHWRAAAREDRGLRLAGESGTHADTDDPWDTRLDVLRARQTLDALAPHHRSALTLRYVDDLPVPEVAAVLDRTVHATEALLVRARLAFRRAYSDNEATDG